MSGIVETATAIRFWRAAGLTFGTAIRQYIENLSTEEDDWLVGEDVLFPGVKGVALRSMKAPGTAYDDPRIVGLLKSSPPIQDPANSLVA